MITRQTKLLVKINSEPIFVKNVDVLAPSIRIVINELERQQKENPAVRGVAMVVNNINIQVNLAD